MGRDPNMGREGFKFGSVIKYSNTDLKRRQHVMILSKTVTVYICAITLAFHCSSSAEDYLSWSGGLTD